jgi:hypothetical protein
VPCGPLGPAGPEAPVAPAGPDGPMGPVAPVAGVAVGGAVPVTVGVAVAVRVAVAVKVFVGGTGVKVLVAPPGTGVSVALNWACASGVLRVSVRPRSAVASAGDQSEIETLGKWINRTSENEFLCGAIAVPPTPNALSPGEEMRPDGSRGCGRRDAVGPWPVPRSRNVT